MTDSRETRNLREFLFQQQRGKCYWCGKQCYHRYSATLKWMHDNFTIDHVKPKSCGGEKRKGDAVGACEECNKMRNSFLTKLKAGKSIDHICARTPELTKKLVDSILAYV